MLFPLDVHSTMTMQFDNPLGRPAVACLVPDKGFTDRRDSSGVGNELFIGTYENPEVNKLFCTLSAS